MTTLNPDVQTFLGSVFSSKLSSTELNTLYSTVADSPLLVSQLLDFVKGTTDGVQTGRKAGTINLLTTGSAGSTYNSASGSTAPSIQLTITDLSDQNGKIPPDPFENTDGNKSATGVYDSTVGFIVGSLLHELGHFEDQFGGLPYGEPANPYFTGTLSDPGTNTAYGLLSEGRAQYNNMEGADQIAAATHGQIQISESINGDDNTQFAEAHEYQNPVYRQQAVDFLAGQYGTALTSNTGDTYLQYYSKTNNVPASWANGATDSWIVFNSAGNPTALVVYGPGTTPPTSATGPKEIGTGTPSGLPAALPVIEDNANGTSIEFKDVGGTNEYETFSGSNAYGLETGYGNYLIQPGDTWASLNAKYGTSGGGGTTLQDLNGQSGSSAPTAGECIQIPLGVSSGMPSGSTVQGLGVNAGYYDTSTGLYVTTSASLDGSTSGLFRVGGSGGQTFFSGAGSLVSGLSNAGGGTNVQIADGDVTAIASNGQVTLNVKGSAFYSGTDDVDVTGNSLDLLQSNSALGGVGLTYTLNADGTLVNPVVTYQPFTLTSNPTYSSALAGEQALAPEVTNDIPIASPTGPVTDVDNLKINVGPLGGGLNGNANGDTTDAGSVPVDGQGNEYVIVGSGVSVTDSNANSLGVFNDSPNDTLTQEDQPGNADVISPTQNTTDQVEGAYDAYGAAQAQAAALQGYYDYLADIADQAYTFADTDPLLIGLNGNGIQLSNWIDNAVYFDTNLNAAGNGADGMEHHTSWMSSGTGMLVFDPNDTAITDITQTLSEYFAGGSTPYNYADGLAALASLSTSSTVFSAATSKTDPNTGKSYWSEIMVATGTPVANPNSTTGGTELAPGQLITLASVLGSTGSISLVGSGNNGESIAGSAVTNRTTATTSSGATDQVAAVSFQTDTAGDITYNQNGGVVINSSPEGGATADTSFIDENSTAQTLALSSGTLTDDGTTVAQHNGEAYNAVFAGAGDTVTVASGDKSSYWLSGGAGTTLNASGAQGNIYFLVTSGTASYTGGSGFNIAQVTDSAPVSIDLGKHNLQEVIGGAGDGTFNASDTTGNAFIQGGSGNNIIIGGSGADALSGGTGDDLIEAGPGGSVIHAGSGNDVIYGGSIKSGSTANSDVIYGGPGNDTVVLGTNNSAVYVGTGIMTIIGNDQQNVGSSSTKAFSVVMFSGSYANYKVTPNADGSTTITDTVAGQNGAVTLENVTNIGFSDLGQTSLTQTVGLPVDDTVNVTGAGPYTIQASTLLANDIDYQSKKLSITAILSSGGTITPGYSGPVTGGRAALSSDGTLITFTPTPGFTGVPSFQYYVGDGHQQRRGFPGIPACQRQGNARWDSITGGGNRQPGQFLDAVRPRVYRRVVPSDCRRAAGLGGRLHRRGSIRRHLRSQAAMSTSPTLT